MIKCHKETIAFLESFVHFISGKAANQSKWWKKGAKVLKRGNFSHKVGDEKHKWTDVYLGFSVLEKLCF